MSNTVKKDLIIIKVGTNVLTHLGQEQDRLDAGSFTSIGGQARAYADRGYAVVVVSSGAITAGILGEQKCREDICDIVDEQRYAARGWDLVVQEWKRAIGAQKVSSTLLTKRELTTNKMRDKLISVMSRCFDYGDVFVVNENDCLSDDEIKFGDNDMLAATLAKVCQQSGQFSSTRLVLLTNINGLYRDIEDENTLISRVSDIEKVRQFAGGAANGHSRGGMRTKIQASHLATSAGIPTTIANGRASQVIDKALNSSTGTLFTP